MTEHKHEIEIENRSHFKTRWIVRNGAITDRRAEDSFFEYSIIDAKELRDWLTARITELEKA